MIYMLFLICLDPLLNKRMKPSYQEHTNEDVRNKLFNNNSINNRYNETNEETQNLLRHSDRDSCESLVT